jgi:glycosyltransferase involved in cell wall biosynthesis
MKLTVIIPVYNERENLESLLTELTAVLDRRYASYRIIFVDDGSTDGSSDVLDGLAARSAQVKVIHLLRNFGQTSAIAAGLDYADGDTIVVMDADHQNNPADIPALIEKLEDGYALVSGWRKVRKDGWLMRVLPSKAANRLISAAVGIRLHDYGCSLKAYRREALEGLRLYGEMHRFLPIFVAWNGGAVTEMVVDHRPRRHGRTKYGLSRISRVLLDLLLIKFFDRQLQHPLHLFGNFGLASMLLAGLTFVAMLYYKYWGGKSFIETPLPILAALFVLMGVMAILMGIVAELVMRTYFESQAKRPYRIRRIRN